MSTQEFEPTFKQTVRIRNWCKFQKEAARTKGPWMKLYRNLLDDAAYRALDDFTGRLLIDIWLVALEHGLPKDEDTITIEGQTFAQFLCWRLRHHHAMLPAIETALTKIEAFKFIKIESMGSAPCVNHESNVSQSCVDGESNVSQACVNGESNLSASCDGTVPPIRLDKDEIRVPPAGSFSSTGKNITEEEYTSHQENDDEEEEEEWEDDDEEWDDLPDISAIAKRDQEQMKKDGRIR